MTVTLRPYQQDIKTEILNHWRAGTRNVCMVTFTGGGKTATFSSIIADHPGFSIAIAHRKELVGQMALALARNGVRHRVIGPPGLTKFVIQEQLRELGTSHYDPNAKCAVASVDTIVARAKNLEHWLTQVTLWVTDECFPAGTLIDGRPIETLRPGDLVTAFNEQTGGFEQREVIHLFDNPMPKYMVRLETATHHVIKSTYGHPFWTRRGWVDAGKLTADDEVLIHERCMHELRHTDGASDKIAGELLVQMQESVLLSSMRECGNATTTYDQKPMHAPKAGEENTESGNLPGMRGDVHTAHSSNKDGQVLLQQNMLERLSVPSFIRNNDSHKPRTSYDFVATDAGKEPNEQPENSSESVSKIKSNGPPSQNSRRQRSSPDRSGTVDVQSGRLLRFQTATYSSDDKILADTRGVPQPLQDRSCECCTQHRSGDRRVKSRCSPETGAGSTQGARTYWARLASVEVYERPSDGGHRVYNIEVDGLHTYIANGVVVHNCHHLAPRTNKWGKAVAMMPNAVGLGPTATPVRADGKGLGRNASGFMDVIVKGPSARWLIDEGYLTDYRVFCPPSDLHLEQVPVTGSGEFSPQPLKKAVRESHLVGDVVDHYLRIAGGKLGVVFNTDVETAADVSAKFNGAGVKCEVVTGTTPDNVRSEMIRRFRKGDVRVLSSVDIFGEGFDLPAIHVVMFARPTQSYSLMVQQFGRALRPVYAKGYDLDTKDGRLAAIAASDKPYAIIIDHVGNVLRHGLPDAPREWSLADRDKRARKSVNDDIPLRPCPECTRPYERVLVKCPYCDFKPEPAGRGSIEYVDGDLYELDADTLARMRSAVEHIDSDFESVAQAMKRAGAPDIAIHGARKQHRMRSEMQEALRESIKWWAGYHKAQGRSDAESMRRFYHAFNIDILTAQSLGRPDALALAERINNQLARIV